jgi:DNA repair protein RadC
MASQSVTRGSDHPQNRTYFLKEVQLVVRDAPMVPAEIAPFVGISYHSSVEVFECFRDLYSLPVECFIALHLNGKNMVTAMTTVSVGSLTRSLVHPREVFRPAIMNGAAGLIFLHNHPSGDPAPSPEDAQITRRLAETGKVIGIRVLDHIVIGDARYFSFADEGML